jgi:hypothetical protein
LVIPTTVYHFLWFFDKYIPSNVSARKGSLDLGIIMKSGVRMWTGFIWLRIGPVWGSCDAALHIRIP